MRRCLGVAIILCFFAGCREYTEDELLKQLHEKDKAFRKRIEQLAQIVSNRVLTVGAKLDADYSHVVKELNDMEWKFTQTIKDLRVREGVRTGCLQNDRVELVPTKGEIGFIPSQNGAFKGVTFGDGNVILHFRNDCSYKCKPSVRVIFYDRHLERLGSVKVSWFWTSLAPNQAADETKELPFVQRPFYFVVEQL